MRLLIAASMRKRKNFNCGAYSDSLHSIWLNAACQDLVSEEISGDKLRNQSIASIVQRVQQLLVKRCKCGRCYESQDCSSPKCRLLSPLLDSVELAVRGSVDDLADVLDISSCPSVGSTAELFVHVLKVLYSRHCGKLFFQSQEIEKLLQEGKDIWNFDFLHNVKLNHFSYATI
ncbi:hypothetical protein PCE1_002504 [Barthelona sp. PCE]